jgi:integrase
MAKRWGSLRVRDFVQHIRSVFKYGFDAGLMTTPMRFGPGFARPSKKNMRLERAERGPRMFAAEELRRLIKAAPQPLKAMILLGVNCGFGNSDCGTLPLSALDLHGGWVNYHRPKTGINRRCALWPETVSALREALKRRQKPKDAAHSELVFITARLGSWHKEGRLVQDRSGGPMRIAGQDSTIAKEMRKLLDSLGINGHRNFYGCRHTFETIGGATKDQVAVDAVMGHADESMAAVYRDQAHGISDERLRALAEHVRAWLLEEDKRGWPR